MRPTTLSRIEKALAALRSHQPIILTDAGNREDEGDLIYPGSTITAEHIAFMLRHTSGIICLSLSAKKAKTLDLPFMVMRDQNSSRYGTPFTVSIEAKTGVTTGVSAQDRAKTIQTALAPQAKPQDLARPGHVFPLVAHQNGVFGRQGHTEGALDLIKLAGFEEGAVLCELMNPDGTMMRGDTLAAFSEQFDIPIASIADLIEY
ncbi:MAG: 3,4-dihydroxy-2-butanone-4-phosphate synthase, partial [Gammaproteobacteria bacterium]|nr:3,4-dihydroxy-2-butanone-4-phosphate synthase [Gammaproteobacteria bacterium]